MEDVKKTMRRQMGKEEKEDGEEGVDARHQKFVNWYMGSTLFPLFASWQMQERYP